MALILKSICLNTNGDATCGSLHLRRDMSTPIDPVFTIKNGKIEPIGVFVPGALAGFHIQLHIEVENDGDQPLSVQIGARETSTPAIFGDLQFAGTMIAPQSTARLTFAINTGYICQPTFINQTQKRRQTWSWYYTALGGTIETPLNTTEQTLYFLHNFPVERMPGTTEIVWNSSFEPYAGNEWRYVWTSLLDIACKACDEYSFTQGFRPSTTQQHLAAIVRELNQNRLFRYDDKVGASFYSIKNAAGNVLVKLARYIRDREGRYQSKLNCSDCAALTAITALCCGVPAYTAIMMNTSPLSAGFGCNPILAIGFDQWAPPFSGGFGYHEITTLTDIPDENTPTYDACLMLDSGSFPGAAGPAGKSALLATGYTFAQTNLHLVTVNPLTPYTGAFYRERLVADGQSCFWIGNALRIVGFDVAQAHTPGIEAAKRPEYLNRVTARFALEENPLAPCERALDWSRVLAGLTGYTLIEDEGRDRVYAFEFDGRDYRVELTFAQNETQAWTLLLTKLAAVSNPNVERTALGDAGFAIDPYWQLFAKGNLIVQVFGDDGGCRAFSQWLLQALWAE